MSALLVAKLLDPRKGLLRGLMFDVERGKGRPDEDSKLINISVGELREADEAIRYLLHRVVISNAKDGGTWA